MIGKLEEILELHKMWLNNEGGKRANLSNTNLRGVDFSNTDLRDADLRYADLRGVDFSNTDLRYADLRYADLRDANLRYANLRYANLRYCIGNNKEIKSLQIGTYVISYTSTILNIGCQSHTVPEWKSFTDREISKMDKGALEWWKLNKDRVIELAEREIKGQLMGWAYQYIKTITKANKKRYLSKK